MHERGAASAASFFSVFYNRRGRPGRFFVPVTGLKPVLQELRIFKNDSFAR